MILGIAPKYHVFWAARSGVMATFSARAKWINFARNVNLFSLPGKMSQEHIQNRTIVKPGILRKTGFIMKKTGTFMKEWVKPLCTFAKFAIFATLRH